LRRHEKQLREVIAELSAHGIRSSLFVDYDNADIPFARELGADRVELYTEPYAETYGQPENAPSGRVLLTLQSWHRMPDWV
jgi:pyridoxine 5-phosphate synthase